MALKLKTYLMIPCGELLFSTFESIFMLDEHRLLEFLINIYIITQFSHPSPPLTSSQDQDVRFKDETDIKREKIK